MIAERRGAPRIWVMLLVFGTSIVAQFMAIALTAALLGGPRLPTVERIGVSELVDRLPANVIPSDLWLESLRRNVYGVRRIVGFGVLFMLSEWLGPRRRWPRRALLAWLIYLSPAVIFVVLDGAALMGGMPTSGVSLDVESLLEGSYSDVATAMLWGAGAWTWWRARSGKAG